MDNGEEHSQDWQTDTPENRRERQTLPLRQVQEAQPKARQNAGPVVLPQLPKRKRPCGDLRIRAGLMVFPCRWPTLPPPNEQNGSPLSLSLDAFFESTTHISFTAPPQLHFHDL